MSKFCTSCGTALEEGQRFCGKCGAPVKAGAAAQGSGTAGVRVNTPAQTGVPVAANSGLLVLGVLLGWLGIHCFTTGKKKRGILELVLWLIGAVFWILRGVLPLIVNPYDFADINVGKVRGIENIMWLLLAIAGVFFVLFGILWISDIVGIVKGRFANKPDEWPAPIKIIKAGLPKWKFTKKHLVFTAILPVLQIVGVLTRPKKIPFEFLIDERTGHPLLVWRLPFLGFVFFAGLFSISSLLCGVFFGPLAGTIVAGLLALVKALVLSAAGTGYFRLPFQSLLSSCIASFVSGLIVYGIPKIRASENKLIQGLWIGIAILVGQILSFAIVNHSFYPVAFFYLLRSQLPYAVIAGVVGVLLPLALAKKGLLLGPFVKREESAAGENR